MALETLLKIEEKFEFLNFVTHIRRDPALGGQQLYLYADTNKDGKHWVSFVQALGDAAKNQLSCFTFLNQQFVATTPYDSLPGCAVDEQERLLYVLFGGAHHDISLKLFHLHYQAPDKFGYCRIVAQEGRCIKVNNRLLCHEMPPFRLFPPFVMSLSICPETGRLVTGYMTGYQDNSVPNSNLQLSFFPADLTYDQEQQKAEVKAVTDRLPFMTPLPKTHYLHFPVFSRSNHLLLWMGVRPFQMYELAFIEFMRSGVQPTADNGHCIFLKSFIPGHPVMNGHLNELKIDPVELVKSFLPKSVFDNFLAQIPDATPKHLFFGAHLRLVGHVNKFVVFSFQQNYILAAKWPREWYKLSTLPAVGVSNSKLMRLDKEKKWGEIDAACLHGTDLYLKSQLGDAQVVRRMALGHKFKDYRRCACCGKEENGKKRNKDGKRMSKFKVCRMCKELNFHHYSDPTLACHYCSNECSRKDWKRHKIIHNKLVKG